MSLAEALPEAEAGSSRGPVVNEAQIVLKTPKNKRGTMKIREKQGKSERDRFGKNLAQLTQGLAKDAPEDAEVTQAARWAALRKFLEQSLEKKDEFRDV
jgi:hypothetical protein